MHIAVTAISLQDDRLDGQGRYARELISRLATTHPEHEFIFLFNRPYDNEFIFSKNIIPVVVSPAASNVLAIKYWYDVKAPLALKKYRPDCWIQPFGYCSMSSSIPQVLVMHDLAFLHHPAFFAWHQRWFYKTFAGRFLQKAASVVTLSEFCKDDISAHYPITTQKISVIPAAAAATFMPLAWHEKQEVKTQYAGGTEYFLCTGGFHPRKNLLNLLRAFSLFKKWQHSNMKLIIAGRRALQYDELIEKLRSYKYRNDVILTGYLADAALAKLTAGAYALVYPSFFEGFGLPIVEAMQAGVPVITSDTSGMPGTGGEAALYAAPADADAIAKHMLRLYRDETFRSRLVDAGTEQAARFSWDRSAAALWELVMTVTSHPGNK
jgi:glycosyltransferase involved in cell wall biosynthesis